jgi:hypothetical protein
MRHLTTTSINNYLARTHKGLKSNCKALKLASQQTSKEFNCKALDVFFLVVENQEIPELYTHSYGFNTSLGRHIKDVFKGYYELNK